MEKVFLKKILKKNTNIDFLIFTKIDLFSFYKNNFFLNCTFNQIAQIASWVRRQWCSACACTGRRRPVAAWDPWDGQPAVCDHGEVRGRPADVDRLRAAAWRTGPRTPQQHLRDDAVQRRSAHLRTGNPTAAYTTARRHDAMVGTF